MPDDRIRTERPPGIGHDQPPVDLIVGAPGLAEYLYGDREKTKQVYGLSALPPPDRPPLFHLGANLAGRRSTLSAWFSEREQAAMAGAEPRVPTRRGNPAPTYRGGKPKRAPAHKTPAEAAE
jgi:hypothetical protein